MASLRGAEDVQYRRSVFNGISGAAGHQGGGWGLGAGTNHSFAAKCSLIHPAHLLENNLIILEEQLEACQPGALKEGSTEPLPGDPMPQVNPKRRTFTLRKVKLLATIGPSWTCHVEAIQPHWICEETGLQGAWIGHGVRQDVPGNGHGTGSLHRLKRQGSR